MTATEFGKKMFQDLNGVSFLSARRERFPVVAQPTDRPLRNPNLHYDDFSRA
jgi:hypothetical protein